MRNILYPTFNVAVFFCMTAVFTACDNGNIRHAPLGDTVAAKTFAPIENDTIFPIDLRQITKIAFPKYRIHKEEPIIPDPMSLAADEETVSGGNFKATLVLDTIPTKIFYALVDSAAKKDTCWTINKFAYIYECKDKHNGQYQVTFSKGSTQIIVTHMNADLVKSKREKLKPEKKRH